MRRKTPALYPLRASPFVCVPSTSHRVLQESLYGYHNQFSMARPATEGGVGGASNSATTTPDGDYDDATEFGAVDGQSSSGGRAATAAAVDAEHPSIVAQRVVADGLDAELAMALRISSEEQLERQLELEREQQMIEEALRLSLEEK